ncbi:hypothetical protein CYLTODRAFT_488769 [Cylindrobasidium torrendii FP15055 ss-10]|uniref:C2H2-type domain-containing protein n=1 Tax=Cylindrobasidium torrendii FP15055 ss-10 TaxID=1314674 RepID=A0A0D7BGI2_9AGAR|nr:hypothetical protein CYLTODRAFT_488769 [Cylindrobasidium torrendii FP15055 ss-10]
MYRSTSGQSQSDGDAYASDGVGQWTSGRPHLTGSLASQHSGQRPPPGYPTSMQYPNSIASSYPAASSNHAQARSSSFSSNRAYADSDGAYAYQAPYPSRSDGIQAHSSSATYATDGHANVPTPCQAYLHQSSFQDESAHPPIPAYAPTMHASSQQYSRLPSSPPASRYGEHAHMSQGQSPSPPVPITARHAHNHARSSTLDQRSPSSSPQDTHLRLQGQDFAYGLHTTSTSAIHPRPGHALSPSSSSIDEYSVQARLGRPQPGPSNFTDNRERDSQRLYTVQPIPPSSGGSSNNIPAASSSSVVAASSSRRSEGRPTERVKNHGCSFPNCNSVFTSANARKRHEQDRHFGKVHRCQHCEETFADSTSVPRHGKVCKKRPGAGGGPYSDS